MGQHPAVGRQHLPGQRRRDRRRQPIARPSIVAVVPTMVGMPAPDVSPYDAVLLVSFGGPGGARGRGAVPRERHPRPRHPARAAGGGGRALLPARRPLADQRPEPRAGRRDPRGPRRRGDRPARLLGQPQLGPLPRRHGRADARRRGHPGGLLRDLGVLVVLRLPAVPREPRRGRGRARGRAAARPAAPLLQPPRLRRGVRRRDPDRAGRPARPGPGGRPPGLRHPLDPRADERAQRPVGRRVRRPAPQRRRPRSPTGSARRPAGATRSTSSTARGRPARRAVARAGRQRPPRDAGQVRDARAW